MSSRTTHYSLTTSASFPPVPRPLKRRATAGEAAGEPFAPVPYQPAPPTAPGPKARSHTTASMDVDPQAIMIHPPFTVFPDSHLYPQGLTYGLLSEHSDWFLDADDFIRTTEGAQDCRLVSYPSLLEPPRGWCPAKKRDLKERGNWAEGEEPRLRCCFCRRTYAGVNAKSMWRRHVFEKHKIAMANRREGNDRSRGRGSGSNKENKAKSTQVADNDQEIEDGPSSSSQEISVEVVVEEPPPEASSSKPLRRTRPVMAEGRKRSRREIQADTEDAPEAPKPETSMMDVEPHSFSKLALGPDEGPLGLTNSLGEIVTSIADARAPPPTPPPRFVIPESPYDPLLTPSFRHSTPRVPSNQPWRFPSPSHPLHSQAHEISLTMLTRGRRPATESSPASHGPGTPLSSPGFGLFLQRKGESPLSFGASGWDRSLSFPSSSPFNRGHLTPLKKGRSISFDTPNKRSDMSPPLTSIRGRHQVRVKSSSDLPDEWLSDASGSGPLADPMDSGSLFNYSSWGDTSASSSMSISSPATHDSPVVRSSSQGMTALGQGIGLLQPFMIDKKRPAAAGSSNNSDTFGVPPKRGYSAFEESQDSDDDDVTKGTDSDEDEDARPRKRRRLSV